MHTTTTYPPTQSQPPSKTPTMPFGKYRGTPLEDLPSEYLLWVGCLDDLRQPLLGHVLREMGRRLAALDQPSATASDAKAGG